MPIPAWLVDLIKTSPYVGVPIFATWMIVRNWCFLLAGTIAVLHPDRERRKDAREAMKLARGGGHPTPAIGEGSPPGKPPAQRTRSKPAG